MLALIQLLLSDKQHLFDFPEVVKSIPYSLVFPVTYSGRVTTILFLIPNTKYLVPLYTFPNT